MCTSSNVHQRPLNNLSYVERKILQQFLAGWRERCGLAGGKGVAWLEGKVWPGWRERRGLAGYSAVLVMLGQRGNAVMCRMGGAYEPQTSTHTTTDTNSALYIFDGQIQTVTSLMGLLRVVGEEEEEEGDTKRGKDRRGMEGRKHEGSAKQCEGMGRQHE